MSNFGSGTGLWVISVGLTKTFDRIEHASLSFAPWNHGVHNEHIRLLSDIYSGQFGTVHGSEGVDITRGVKLGDVLSSLLFNAGLEQAPRRFEDRVWGKGIDLGADDVLLHSTSADEVIFMLAVLQQELNASGLELNATKTRSE